MTTVRIFRLGEPPGQSWDDLNTIPEHGACLLISKRDAGNGPDFLIHVLQPIPGDDVHRVLLELLNAPVASAEVPDVDATPLEE